jgi:hypothetical protein
VLFAVYFVLQYWFSREVVNIAVYVGFGLGLMFGLAVFFVSQLWTKLKMRRILRQMPEQSAKSETSLAFWMRRPKAERDAAVHGLRRNPFDPLLRVLKKMRLFED